MTGCATKLTLISPPVPAELTVKCVGPIAEPLTTADQYDLGRALVQAVRFGQSCAVRQAALVDAVQGRDEILRSIKQQLEK